MGARLHRLRRFLRTYGYTGTIPALLDLMQDVLRAHEHGIKQLAATGDPLFAQLLHQGVVDNLHRAAAELREFTWQ
jgi:hypothetical protein